MLCCGDFVNGDNKAVYTWFISKKTNKCQLMV